MNEIEKYISENNYKEALNECYSSNHNYLGILLSYIIEDDNDRLLQQFNNNIKGFGIEGGVIREEKEEDLFCDKLDTNTYGVVRVKLLANWIDSKGLREIWNKMSQGNYRWNNIKIVLDNDVDYFVVINAPPNGVVLTDDEKKKTIVFRMEPYMDSKNKDMWGEWSSPDVSKFFRVCSHDKGVLDYNNNEWHLSKSYTELKNMTVEKDEKRDSIVSTVLSDKYYDPGHIKRVDFVKFLEKKGMSVDVYGSNVFGYKEYKGSLPSNEKDNAMFPYKYVFNVENNSINNYYTEKLIDGILAECLVFYSGCFNITDFIDERAFIYLELSNFEDDYKKIKKAIEDNEWEKRIDIIRNQKNKILDHLQFFPRLERIINNKECLPSLY